MRGREGALIAYVMGGDPNPRLSQRVVEAVIKGGADILELGIPFSDPIADGKVIQAAGVRALTSGTRPKDVMRIADAAKQIGDLPIVLMTYYNVLYSQGVDRFLEEASKHHVDGTIIPDLPVEEAASYRRLAKRYGMDTIMLAAPTTTPERMKTIVASSSGFLYFVSLLGVTGARKNLGENAVSLIRFAENYTRGKIPLAVGFGISKPEHVSTVIGAGADGAIVGSAIVDRVASRGRGAEEMLEDVGGFVRQLKAATKT